MFGWCPWTRIMAFEASMCSNLSPDWAIRLWRVEHLVLISTRPRNLSRIDRALLLVTRLLRGLLRVDPGDHSLSARLSGSIEIQRPSGGQCARPRVCRARETKSAPSRCRRRTPVLCAGHRDCHGRKRNNLRGAHGVISDGE